MKKYRHRETGYEVRVTYFAGCKVYRVRGYSVACGWIELSENDFHKLFKPVEEYCCTEFEDLVDRGLFYRDVQGRWVCLLKSEKDSQLKLVTHCFVCGKRPL